MTQNAWFLCELCAAISVEISILIQTGAESWGRFPVPRICRWESKVNIELNIEGNDILTVYRLLQYQKLVNFYILATPVIRISIGSSHTASLIIGFDKRLAQQVSTNITHFGYSKSKNADTHINCNKILLMPIYNQTHHITFSLCTGIQDSFSTF